MQPQRAAAEGLTPVPVTPRVVTALPPTGVPTATPSRRCPHTPRGVGDGNPDQQGWGRADGRTGNPQLAMGWRDRWTWGERVRGRKDGRVHDARMGPEWMEGRTGRAMDGRTDGQEAHSSTSTTRDHGVALSRGGGACLGVSHGAGDAQLPTALPARCGGSAPAPPPRPSRPPPGCGAQTGPSPQPPLPSTQTPLVTPRRQHSPMRGKLRHGAAAQPSPKKTLPRSWGKPRHGASPLRPGTHWGGRPCPGRC